MPLLVLLISVEATGTPMPNATQGLLNDVWGRGRFQLYTFLFWMRLPLDTVLFALRNVVMYAFREKLRNIIFQSSSQCALYCVSLSLWWPTLLFFLMHMILHNHRFCMQFTKLYFCTNVLSFWIKQINVLLALQKVISKLQLLPMSTKQLEENLETNLETNSQSYSTF